MRVEFEHNFRQLFTRGSTECSVTTFICFSHNLSTMSTASSLSCSDSQAERDREKFSHQTLILTALTAINNPSRHSTFNDALVNRERIQYMREKASHTPIIDAATTILITDTEILVTMSRAHSIVSFKEIKGRDEEYSLLHQELESRIKDLNSEESMKLLKQFDEFLPNVVGDDAVADKYHGDVFVSFPNINERIPMQESTSDDYICRPIAEDKGYWKRILESKSGYIFDPLK